MTTNLSLTINRASGVTLAEQIRLGLAAAINSGVLAPGARLPSWRDLAAQLGVARGTVRIAYEHLVDAQLVITAGPGGTRVAKRPSQARTRTVPPLATDSFISKAFLDFSEPRCFQMGGPAQDCFPAKLMTRIRARAVRDESLASSRYPDPRGEAALRQAVAAHLAIARGIECDPAQVFITGGFGSGLGLVLRVLGLDGRRALVENPGYTTTRRALELSGIAPVLVPVDEDGMDVARGFAEAPDAALAVLTPGQQAPLGPTLSLERRLALLDWAAANDAWIVEDDYLGELQLRGRAAPALMSLDQHGRVLYVGTFSKTLSPMLRLGFVVLPAQLTEAFSAMAACFGSAPGPAVQMAVAEMMRDGHYMRHLRRTKRVYAQRSEALMAYFSARGLRCLGPGLAVLVQLPEGVDDARVAEGARALGLAPSPLSDWYGTAPTHAGLLLNVAATPPEGMQEACDLLCGLIARLTPG